KKFQARKTPTPDVIASHDCRSCRGLILTTREVRAKGMSTRLAATRTGRLANTRRTLGRLRIQRGRRKNKKVNTDPKRPRARRATMRKGSLCKRPNNSAADKENDKGVSRSTSRG